MATKDANGALHDENGKFTGNGGGGGTKKATAKKVTEKSEADSRANFFRLLDKSGYKVTGEKDKDTGANVIRSKSEAEKRADAEKTYGVHND